MNHRFPVYPDDPSFLLLASGFQVPGSRFWIPGSRFWITDPASLPDRILLTTKTPRHKGAGNILKGYLRVKFTIYSICVQAFAPARAEIGASSPPSAVPLRSVQPYGLSR